MYFIIKIKKKKKKKNPTHEIPTCQPAQSQQLFERIVLEAYSNYLSGEHHSNPSLVPTSNYLLKHYFRESW